MLEIVPFICSQLSYSIVTLLHIRRCQGKAFGPIDVALRQRLRQTACQVYVFNSNLAVS